MAQPVHEPRPDDRGARRHDEKDARRHDARLTERDDVREPKPAKTSAAATFALVFGLSALLSFLTLVLAPLALVLAVIGILLGVAGLTMTKRRGVTGKGLAIAGLVMSVLVLLLGLLGVIGVSTFLNDDQAVERLEQRVEQLRDQVPTDVEIPTGS
ncbi:hypothetical protein [uncultured Pseudokineococcus sp.]|uniref:hypothetical protein n=1 Tax=uncultured Pseudokineococcus sp. TaxID=1642928 RepID=UPI002605A2CD|nr:hypothetical protein [uncultured Pseudokineococcus sp.]